MEITASGRAVIVKKFSAVVTPGTAISLTVPIKTISIKPVGGTIWFKGADDADADAFPLNDGDILSLDLSLRYVTDTSILGNVFTTAGAVDVYAVAGF